ncbi:MAG: hypothetical protein EB167_08675 [Nitrososphaeria archaeon]|nr:hypothetical protein [Nitrososphaeria archaeon]
MNILVNIKNNHIFFIALITVAGLAIRLYYSSYNIPLSLDGLLYFWYATDTSALGHLPQGYTFPNNLWPLFVSPFFYMLKSNNFLDFMYLQRLLSISISVITVIPVYFLCRHFFDKQYAIIGVILFVFEPRIVQNSTLGLTEPLSILFGTSTLALFFSKKMKYVYSSFATLALFSLTRYEGLLLIIPITVMYFARFGRNKHTAKRYLLAIAIFVLVITPITYSRIQITGRDGLTSHILAGANVASSEITSNDHTTKKFSITNGLVTFVKLIGWSTVPMFILFIPFGIYAIFKNRNFLNYSVVFAGITLLIPAVYAYSRNIEEIRYLFIVFPLFSLISLYMIKAVLDRSRWKKPIIIALMVGVILSSGLFLNWKINNEHELEAVKIAKEVAKRTSVINDYHPESVYLRTVGFEDQQDFAGKREIIHNKIKVLFAEKFSSLKEFLDYAKEQKLEFLLVDDQRSRPAFLKDILENESKYPFLTKEYDSGEHGFKYRVKIFRINYEMMSE